MDNSLMEVPFYGKSMLPTLKDGDRLLIETLDYSVNIGDIVLFKSADQFVAHRVILLDGKHDFKGDRAMFYDVESSSRIFGKIVGIKRGKYHYSWNDQGMPYQEVMASFSSKTTWDRNKLVRYFFLILMIVVNIIAFFLLTKKPVSHP